MDAEQITAVKRMQSFIEAHRSEPITLAGLARAARYSPWHAARLFKEYVGRAPFQYVRQRRLSAAAPFVPAGYFPFAFICFHLR